MAINLTALNNITPFVVNNSLINETSDIGANLVTNANVQSQGYLGLGMMITLFLVLMIILMAEQEVFRLNFLNAYIISSGLSLLVGIVLLISNIGSSFQHVMWFAILFMIGILGKFYENK
jgi:hypothetical protein